VVLLEMALSTYDRVSFPLIKCLSLTTLYRDFYPVLNKQTQLMKNALPKTLSTLPYQGFLRGSAWLYALGTLLPLWWLVVTAFQPEGVNIEQFPLNLGWFQGKPSLATWQALWDTPALGMSFLYTVIVTITTATCNVLSSLLLAFMLERKSLKQYTALVQPCILAATSIPFQVLLIPLYLEMNTLGLTDTPQSPLPALLGLILPFAFSGFGVFYIRAALKTCPIALEEAAMLEGASTGFILWRIVVPQLQPTLISLFTMSSIATWGDFLWPNVVLLEPEHLTLPIFLARLQQTLGDQWRLLAAGALLSTLPSLGLFLALQTFMTPTQQGSALK
jgi:putative chitobiose transport system permease protein